MSSSSRSRRYDVFPSFSGEDVRKSFLSHLLKELDHKLINTFKDHGIERSRPIDTELLFAIRESRISIVVFSKKYASSTWCLNELLEIHKCYEELEQMVIPIFYNVDPSDVRKQTGDFGKAFEETCRGKAVDVKQRWMIVLTKVANMAGEDSQNWSDEANMIETIVKDVLNKLITPSTYFGDFVGIEAHLEAMSSMLSLESEEARMVGILGPSGIGKTTIARALFSQLSSQFCHRAFVAYKRTNRDDYGMKLFWEEQFLSEILCQINLKVFHIGTVEQRLKCKKVFIVLDDVDDLELLKTLVGHTHWFGPGSIIIVITKDRQILKSHKIDHVYKVDFPSQDLALEMFCRFAFGQNHPPDGFVELATKVVKLVGNLPLGITILGSSLKEMDKEQWTEMLPRLQNGIDGKIEKTLRVGYDGLDGKDQEIFLSVACLFNGHKVNYINSLLGDSANIGLRTLADKSLIRIKPLRKIVQMHSLLQMLGREIVRVESIHNPGKRRFLFNAEDICDVFTENTGSEHMLGLYFNTSEIKESLFIDKKSFKGMRNLQFLKIYVEFSWETSKYRLNVPQGLSYLPRKLKLLHWDACPLKCMPSNFKAEHLVKLKMIDSELEKLWEGIQPLGSLKKIRLDGSSKLKELPNLSNAINLEKMYLSHCASLVTPFSSFQNLNKLRKLSMGYCTKLENVPTGINLESLEYLDFSGCSRLRSFPQISRNVSRLFMEGTAIENEEDSLWIENIFGLTELYWSDCPLKCMPSKFCAEYLVKLIIQGSKLEKLWEGTQSLGSLLTMDLSLCKILTEIPNLSKATNLEHLELNFCQSLVTMPSSIRNLNKLENLCMEACTSLELLPTGINLKSLTDVNLNGCFKLKSFPQISTNIRYLSLDHTAIEEVPSWIENFSRLLRLKMNCCEKLRKISPNIFQMKCLENVDFSFCEGVTSCCDQLPGPDEASFHLTEFYSDSWVSPFFFNPRIGFNLHNCFNLDHNSRKFIIQSDLNYAILPDEDMPTYFTHQAYGSSLTITLPQSSLSQEMLWFKVCVMLDPPTDFEVRSSCIGVHWHFRGTHRVHHLNHSYNMESQLFMFCFALSTKEVNDLPFESSSNDMRFEFFTHNRNSSACNYFSSEQSEMHPHFSQKMTNCLPLTQRIKRCGVRVLTVSPDSTRKSLEFEYNQGENDAKTARNKMPTPMTVANTALNLELSLGLGEASSTSKTPAQMTVADTALSLEFALGLSGASAQVSSRSSSVSSTSFHGDGALLHLSLTP